MGITLSKSMVRRIIRVTAILSVALAAGQLVQTVAKRPAPQPESALKAPINIVQLSAVPQDEAMPMPAPVKADRAVSAEPATLTSPLPEAAVTADCTPVLHLSELPGAMADVQLLAPCDGGARVVLGHGGLAVTLRVPMSGQLEARLPVMEPSGRFEVRMPDGRKAAAELPMALDGTRRFAVQWAGAQGFVLHGLENAAEYGGKGDVSPSQPGMMADGGWLSLIGDSSVDKPLLAQVYTYPESGEAEVVVEAPVTAQTCGRDLVGQTVQSKGGAAETTDLTLSMPDCSAVGDFLVLKNLAQDVKVAAR